jgi:hypothetical protein
MSAANPGPVEAVWPQDPDRFAVDDSSFDIEAVTGMYAQFFAEFAWKSGLAFRG